PFYAFANVLRTQFLIPRGKDIVYTFAIVGGALINIVANIILIPYYGAMGAVFGNVAAEVSVSIIQAIWLRKEVKIEKYLKHGIPFLTIGIIMSIVVKASEQVLEKNVIGLMCEVAIGGLVD